MSITHLTFVDIETVPDIDKHHDLFLKRFEREIRETIDEVPYPAEGTQETTIRRDTARQIVWDKKASLHAEFGKIIAISIGKMVTENVVLTLDQQSEKQKAKETIDKFYIRSLTSRDEATLLRQASESISRAGGTLVGHNSIEFDFPFLMRRYMVNGIQVPEQLNVGMKKPWELKLEDTMKIWGGTSWGHKVSLELLAHVLGIPSPKSVMNGSDVAQVYWDSFKPQEGKLPFDVEQEAMKKIGDYCSEDVLCTANCYLRMKGLPLIESVEYV
jgi:hypothetical protein